MMYLLWVIVALACSWAIGLLTMIIFGESMGEGLIAYMAGLAIWFQFSAMVAIVLSIIWGTWFVTSHSIKVEVRNVPLVVREK